MPEVKIADAPVNCTSPDHNPASMVVREPGTYEHTCSGCGYKTRFEVGSWTCSSGATVYERTLPTGEFEWVL